MKKTPIILFATSMIVIGGYTWSEQSKAEKQPLDDKCWSISFEDSFDELSLWQDSDAGIPGNGRWRTRYIWDRETIINQELQFYIDPELHGYSPFRIEDGVLNIVAEPTPQNLKDKVSGQAYISGVLTTEKGFSQKYGRFEVRAKVPEGRGLWSAFWLLPSFDRWPDGVAILPEIDVMEHLGHEANTFHTTLHTNQTGELTSHPYDHTLPIRLTENFHVYTVVWTEDTVSWYLDGQWKVSHPTPEDFTRPVHFLLNMAVGGGWPGSPDATTQFPASYQIDYVRAYTPNDQCN
ncbi:MAG: glycoside hydrolase family 16 protein [Granulosicoccus sp.]|nr:glycoside hydrolase family 16 protein [Granulosicoccus sp.]